MLKNQITITVQEGKKPQQITKLREWIRDVIVSNKFALGEINYVFTSNKELLKINKEYLQHDTYTDIITFDYTIGKIISGEIFISVEQVKENAKLYKRPFVEELHRVMIHGVLHLVGFKDDSVEAQAQMRKKEDKALTMFNN